MIPHPRRLLMRKWTAKASKNPSLREHNIGRAAVICVTLRENGGVESGAPPVALARSSWANRDNDFV
jgi:hypothetical protein